MCLDAAEQVADVDRGVDQVLVFSAADALEAGYVDDDWVFDVFKLLGTDVNDGLVVGALHVDLQADEVLIKLQVVVLEVDLVSTLFDGSSRN